jgi:hypothetical protein
MFYGVGPRSQLAPTMDEPQLRQLIASLAKKLAPKFEEVRDAADRVRLVLEELDYDKFILGLGLSSHKDEKDYPRKNVEVGRSRSYFCAIGFFPQVSDKKSS